MTNNFYMDNYKPDHTRFGGIINLSDFNTNHRGKENTKGSPIAKDIASDWRFDNQCKRNIELRERAKVIDKHFGKKKKGK